MLSCSGNNPDLWDEEIEYESGQEACIESGLVYVAIKAIKESTLQKIPRNGQKRLTQASNGRRNHYIKGKHNN